MQTTERITNPLGLDIIDATGYGTGQDYHDPANVAAIADNMARNGWQGPPLVVLPDYARSYTGTHRLLAAAQVELDEVPAVDLADLFTACGLDLDAILDDEDLSILDHRVEILRHLPADVLAAYTLDDII